MADEEGATWVGDGSIDFDEEWPGTLAKWMSEAYPLGNNTALRVSMHSSQDPVLGGASHVVNPCSDRHVHLLVCMKATFDLTNLVLIYSFALAHGYAEIDWAEAAPPWDVVRAWLVRLREALIKQTNDVGVAHALRDDGIWMANFKSYHQSLYLRGSAHEDAPKLVPIAQGKKLVH